MRDPFESGPVLRLGDAKAKSRETGIVPRAEIYAIEAPKTETAIPRPPSLDPAFGDAFGEAFSKPSHSNPVDRRIEGVAAAYGVSSRPLRGPDPEAMTATQKAELNREVEKIQDNIYQFLMNCDDRSDSREARFEALRNFCAKLIAKRYGVDLRGAKADDVTITGIARKTADGAMRYEPAPRLSPAYAARVEPEVFSEEEFARRYPGPVSMFVFDEVASISKKTFDSIAKKDRSK